MKLFFTGVVVLAAASMAAADVKMVSEVNVTGVPAQMQGQLKQKFPQTVTEYRKEGRTRTEVEGAVYLHDCAGEKTYVLDPAAKTYRVVATQASAIAPPASPLLAMLQFSTRGVNAKESGETKEVAGHGSKKHTVSATVDVGLAGGEGMPPLFQLNVSAESWNAADVKMPASKCANAATGGVTPLPIPDLMAKGVKPVVDSLAGLPGTALSRKITLKVTSTQPIDILPKEPIVLTTDVKSVSEEALDDAIFSVPADYKLVETPPAPAAPAAPTGIAPTS